MILDSEQFLPVVSLFCGAGGLDTGFLQRGFKPYLPAPASGFSTANWTHRTSGWLKVDGGCVWSVSIRKNTPSSNSSFLEATLRIPEPSATFWRICLSRCISNVARLLRPYH